MTLSDIEIRHRKVWGLPEIVPWSAQDYLAHLSVEYYERIAGMKLKIEDVQELFKE